MISRVLAGLTLLAIFCLARPAQAEPYLALQTGYKCNVCHVNPTGGGLRNDFGTIYSKTLLPAENIDSALDKWTGKIGDMVRVGGDLRADWTRDTAPNTPTAQGFALEQFRLYGDFTLIPDRLGVYVDEQVAPGGATTEEAYIRYGNTNNHGFYFKGGQFYLPFGWRLQDQSAFVRELTGVSMATPDKGVEIGYEHTNWSAQLDFTNGAANPNGSGNGKQVTGQVVYIQPIWRVGVAALFEQTSAGNRRVGGLFAGLRTGPVAWLAEADIVHDDSFPGGRNLAAGLVEGDWRILKGHNLKVTAEYSDPDRNVAENQQTRYSILYEFTPLPFLQFRAGYRRYYGIPQSPAENQRLILAELHGYF